MSRAPAPIARRAPRGIDDRAFEAPRGRFLRIPTEHGGDGGDGGHFQKVFSFLALVPTPRACGTFSGSDTRAVFALRASSVRAGSFTIVIGVLQYFLETTTITTMLGKIRRLHSYPHVHVTSRTFLHSYRAWW